MQEIIAKAVKRKAAITKYKILAIIHALLGAGLLTCAILATRYDQDQDDEFNAGGPPFFIGGYIVGILQLFAAFLAGCLVKKSRKDPEDEVACMLVGHIIVGMLTFMGCFIGLIFAGIFGLSVYTEKNTVHADRTRKLAYAIMAGLGGAILATVYSMYLTCLGGPDRDRFVNSVGATSCSVNAQPGTSVDLLRNQNRLLQEQLALQRQMLSQQQLQHQQQQQRQPGGPINQPPPDYATVISDPNYIPAAAMPAPPPSYRK